MSDDKKVIDLKEEAKKKESVSVLVTAPNPADGGTM